jgi:hypothetical protein
MHNKEFEIFDIINSIRFYLMLSITCHNNDYFVGDPDEQLKFFLRQIEQESFYSKDRINSYIRTASDSIPASFLKKYGVDPVNRR